MHDVKDLLGSVVEEEPAAKSEKVSIDLIFRPKFFEFVKRSKGFSNSSLDSSSMRSHSRHPKISVESPTCIGRQNVNNLEGTTL
jgi:hypothetical protein